MDKRVETQYQPNYTVAPGEVLADELELRGMTQHELSKRTGLTPKHIVSITKAKCAITPETAIKLERALGMPAQLWLNLESRYQEVSVRLREERKLEAHLTWLSNVPVNHMAKMGWIEKHKDAKAQLVEMLCFFAIASVDQWADVWSSLKILSRRPAPERPRLEAISAWLRRGEIEAAKICCGRYDRSGFRDNLKEVRKLTAQGSEVFLPILRETCADWGVALVFVPALPKQDIGSACRWLNANKALIQLDGKFKTDDELWVEFLQEAAHILLHPKKGLFLDDLSSSNDEMQREAREFAANEALPKKEFLDFVNRGKFNRTSILAFAKEAEVAAGIVVGQLQQRGLISRASCNDLKLPFSWDRFTAHAGATLPAIRA